MALTRVEPKNIIGRIRNLILGKEKPNLLIRVSCGIGLVIWIYLVSWHVLTLLALLLYRTLKHPEAIIAAFNRVGGRYGLGDPMNILFGHATLQLILYFIMLIGLILIYRKKRFGFILYIFATAATFLATFIIMGSKYMVNETSLTDAALLVASAIYFGIGLLLFFKKPKEKSASND